MTPDVKFRQRLSDVTEWLRRQPDFQLFMSAITATGWPKMMMRMDLAQREYVAILAGDGAGWYLITLGPIAESQAGPWSGTTAADALFLFASTHDFAQMTELAVCEKWAAEVARTKVIPQPRIEL